MKKRIAFVLAVCLLLSSFALTACGNEMMTYAPTEATTEAESASASTATSTDGATLQPALEPTGESTVQPTEGVTDEVTLEVTGAPTELPTDAPTEKPSITPPWANLPTVELTEEPTEKPSITPPWTNLPTVELTEEPTEKPSITPPWANLSTDEPTDAPTTAQKPTQEPSEEVKISSEGIYVREGDFIYFGEYPQSVKAPNVTITNQKDSRGYYLGSDGAYYAKRDSDPYSLNYKFSDGSEISFDIYYFKVEPIRWRILEKADGTYFLLCDTVLEGQKFDRDDENNYAESDIRAWLNGTFYQQAFSSLQQENILVTTVDNSAASTAYPTNPNACIDTNDKIFLLSYDEVTNGNYGGSSLDGSLSDYDLSIVGSDYAIARWIYVGNYGTCNWWLRSPDNSGSSYVGFVNFHGEIGHTDSDSVLVGVVPALKMKVLDDMPDKEPEETIEAPDIPSGEAFVRDENYIWFGEYPQSLKKDDVSVTETVDARGYYLGSDGAYYAKVVASPGYRYCFANGRYIEKGTVYYFKVEPIRWRILTEEDGKAFLLCDSIIERQPYYYDPVYVNRESNNYAESTIRAWLNDTFYQTVFNELQKEIILTTTVDNSAETTFDEWNPYACENTNDRIFLLSCKEAANSAYGFSSAEARQMKVSDYVRACGFSMNTSSLYYGNGEWWLRSPSCVVEYQKEQSTVDGYGCRYRRAVRVFCGVVPALWISLE